MTKQLVKYNILQVFGRNIEHGDNLIDLPLIKWLRENVQELDASEKSKWELVTITDEWMIGGVEFDESVSEELVTAFRLTWS